MMNKADDNNAARMPQGDMAVNFTFLVIYLGALSAFGSFVNDLYLPSLPDMMRAFHISVSTDELGLTMGMVGLGLGQILLGPLSDMNGRKGVLRWSTVMFLVACVACLFARDITFFLVCRVVQGFGASAGYFLGRTIPADIYSGRALARVMAIVGAINGFAPASAPVIGGFLGSVFGWRGAFFFLTFFGVLILIFLPRLKETLPPDRRVKGNYFSAFSSYGTLFRNRAFMIHALFKGVALGMLFAYISSAPFIFEQHYGWSQTAFGIFIGCNSLAIMAGSFLALRFRPLKNGLTFAAWIAFAFAALQAISLFLFDKFWIYELLWLPILLALGIVFNAASTIAMNEGRASAGNASAVIGLMGYIFGAAVSPLVGKGDVMHSTAISIVVLSLLMLGVAFMSKRIRADLIGR